MSGMRECKLCGNVNGNTTLVAKEMMFGLHDEFVYIQCAHCGALQISEIPTDLAKYYPANYYSFSNTYSIKSLFKTWRRGKLYAYRFNKYAIIGALFTLLGGKCPVWMSKKYAHFKSNILDIGCGAGELLLEMQQAGFKHLTGIDPFIEKDIQYKNGLTIYKKNIYELTGQFDFIMMHHSFEHMEEPFKVLEKLTTLLPSGGYALIRIPVADTFAFRTYGANWVNLDAPRHFFLHTSISIQNLANAVGLQLVETIYDSHQLQFFGSELYKQGISLVEFSTGKHANIFTASQMKRFQQTSEMLNANRNGDFACFYLKKL
jgi:SAM-dependent methyltransferase